MRLYSIIYSFCVRACVRVCISVCPSSRIICLHAICDCGISRACWSSILYKGNTKTADQSWCHKWLWLTWTLYLPSTISMTFASALHVVYSTVCVLDLPSSKSFVCPSAWYSLLGHDAIVGSSVEYKKKAFESWLSKTDEVLSEGSKGSLTLAIGKCLWFSVKIKVCQSSLSSHWSYPDLSTLWLWNSFLILNASKI